MKRIALVTGGNRGIGFEVVRQLGLAGFRVFVGARRAEDGAKAVSSLAGEKVEAEYVSIDVSDMKSIQGAFRVVSGSVTSLDVLVNNAGILLAESSDILAAPFEEIEASLRTNALGALMVTRIFRPLLKKGSRVINVSSKAGQISGGMGTYAPAYSFSKVAMNAITCLCAHVLRPEGIAVNAMCPGWVRTDMGGSSATRSVREGADTAVWLATEAPIRETGKFWKERTVIAW